MNKRLSVHWVGNTVSWSNTRTKSNRIKPWRWTKSSFLFYELYIIRRPHFVQVIWTELAAFFRETTLRHIHITHQEVLVNREYRLKHMVSTSYVNKTEKRSLLVSSKKKKSSSFKIIVEETPSGTLHYELSEMLTANVPTGIFTYNERQISK